MPLEQEMPVQFQVVELPSGHHLCKVRALNRGDANSEVTVYYQVSGPFAHSCPHGCVLLKGPQCLGEVILSSSRPVCGYTVVLCLGSCVLLKQLHLKTAPVSEMDPFSITVLY